MLARKSGIAGFTFALMVLVPIKAAAAGPAKAPAHKSESAAASRILVWSDEFNGANGSAPDSSKWIAITNDSGFGNRELEYYTSRPANIHQKNGDLVITARRETYSGPDGASRQYTSARIESRGRFQLKYGRVEARIKIPKGQGIWPAFWMLGSDFHSIGWPACGEVDIMENIGSEPSRVHGSLHGPGYSGSHPLTGAFTLENNARFSDGFHIFAIEWEPHTIRFYVDDRLYETQSADRLPAGTRWAFDHPFYLVLNVAVGGYWPGNPDPTTRFPTSMLVDYVRVYQLKDAPQVVEISLPSGAAN